MADPIGGTPENGTALNTEGAADAFARLLNSERPVRPQPTAQRTTAQEPPANREDPEPGTQGEDDDDFSRLPPEIRNLLDPDAGTEEVEGEGDEQPAKRKITIPGAGENGEDIELDEDEVRKGYLRQQDYTRKTMSLAERARMLEESASAIENSYQQLNQFVQINSALLQQMRPAEPNWAELQAKSPTLYLEARARYDFAVRQWEGKLQELQTLKANADLQYAQATQARTLHVIQNEHRRLIEAMPELKDREKAKGFKENILAYAKKIGLQEQDLDNLLDHRALLVLDKARRFDEMIERAARIASKRSDRTPAIASSTPGPVQRTPTAVTNVTRAKQQHAKIGTVKSAAAAFEAMLAANQKGQQRRR